MDENVIIIAGQKIKETVALRASMIIGISLIIMVFILAVLLIVTMVKISNLNKKYAAFMKGANGKDLESSILSRFKDIDKMKADIEYMSGKLNIACETLLTTYQKMSIIKYDAFKEMGGKLSFSLAMLDDKNNGYILTSVHTRDGCYTYVKEIIKGESFVVLAEEERKALEEAKNKRNYMG
ncbi:MAG: DUF4446 family protein [Lachnospiraceae bacterium]|nr:DUF4446 family protein [Lachnospiraceae bacterium]